MTDIIPRLEKLAGLLRHDDEAREICEDAIREIARLSGAPVPGTLSNPNAGGHVQLDYWRMMQIKFCDGVPVFESMDHMHWWCRKTGYHSADGFIIDAAFDF